MKNVVPAHRRRDISDETWALLEPHLPGREGALGVSPRTIDCLSMRFSGYCERVRRGGIRRWITADGANMHRRFIRWRDKGVWEKLLDLLINEPDDE